MKKKTRSPLFSFADATSAVMAGTFVLAFVLIRSEMSTVPPSSVSGLIRVEVPILNAAITNQISLSNLLVLEQIIVNGKQIRQPLYPQDLVTPYKSEAKTGTGLLKCIVKVNEGTIMIISQAENLSQPCEVIVKIRWKDQNLLPTIWPEGCRSIAAGSAIHRSVTKYFNDKHLPPIVTGIFDPQKQSALRITLRFDPRLQDHVVEAELVSATSTNPDGDH